MKGSRSVSGGVRVFAHTADVGLAVRGGSLEELFRWAATGLSRLAVRRGPTGVGRAARTRRRTLPVNLAPARDPEALLVDWLNHLIFLLETEAAVPGECSLRVERATGGEWVLTGSVTLERLPGGALPATVKGATFHGLKITRSRQGAYRARVILDV